MKHYRQAIGLASALLLLFVLSSAPALAACKEPSAPAVPDGRSASKDEMLAAYRDMRSYQGEAQVYLDCLQAEKDAATDPEVMLDRLNAYNETVEKMDTISRRTHRELDIFNSR